MNYEKESNYSFNEYKNDSKDDDIYKDCSMPVIILSLEEKIRCLEEIENKLKKLLYVYDESQKPNSNYNYKVYIGGVIIYVSSSNMLFGGELVNIIVNLNAIMNNNFSKAQIKRIVFESKNYCQYLLTNYRKEYDSKDIQTIEDL